MKSFITAKRLLGGHAEALSFENTKLAINSMSKVADKEDLLNYLKSNDLSFLGSTPRDFDSVKYWKALTSYINDNEVSLIAKYRSPLKWEDDLVVYEDMKKRYLYFMESENIQWLNFSRLLEDIRHAISRIGDHGLEFEVLTLINKVSDKILNKIELDMNDVTVTTEKALDELRPYYYTVSMDENKFRYYLQRVEEWFRLAVDGPTDNTAYLYNLLDDLYNSGEAQEVFSKETEHLVHARMERHSTAEQLILVGHNLIVDAKVALVTGTFGKEKDNLGKSEVF